MRKSSRTDRPPVVVVGGYQTGVVLMRDLIRKQIETCCIDCDGTTPVFKTVYGKAHLCPNRDTHPAEWEQFMIGLAQSIGRKPVLIPSADQFVSAIAAHAAALEPHFIFQADSVATQALLATKKRQYEFADVHGLPVPRTRFVESIEEIQRFAAEARFPCLIKRVHFRGWQRFPKRHPLLNEKIALVASAEELEAMCRLAESVTPDVVVQEIIEGPDDAKLVYLSCYGKGSRRLGHCVVRQLRTAPIYCGSASVVGPIHDAEGASLCDAFFRSIGYEGICELELKRGQPRRSGEVDRSEPAVQRHRRRSPPQALSWDGSITWI